MMEALPLTSASAGPMPREHVSLLRDRSELPPLAADLSPHFQAFLSQFVEHGLRSSHRVYVARGDCGLAVGLGIADPDVGIASIFAVHGEACEKLRQALDVTEFFTEHRHPSSPSGSGGQDAKRDGREQPVAYDVYETYAVLELRAPAASTYDASVVTRMTPSDLPDVSELSAIVYGVRGDRSLEAALAIGEVGFVARVGGELAGYAFAAVAGDVGRLHSNTVTVHQRGRGLGRELMRARVNACAALGASRLLTEIATWNVASLGVARGAGFEQVGTMWIESSSGERSENGLWP